MHPEFGSQRRATYLAVRLAIVVVVEVIAALPQCLSVRILVGAPFRPAREAVAPPLRHRGRIFEAVGICAVQFPIPIVVDPADHAHAGLSADN